MYLYKFTTISGKIKNKSRERILAECIKDNKIYLPHRETLNDPWDGLTKENQDIGIISFTTKNDNHLMWAHYANQFSGICIAFEIIDINKINLHKVHYIEDTSELRIIKNPFLIKNKSWAYENEYRYVDKRFSTYISLNDIGLRYAGIYLGHKSVRDKYIQNLAYSFNLKYCQIKIGNDYQISIHPQTGDQYIKDLIEKPFYDKMYEDRICDLRDLAMKEAIDQYEQSEIESIKQTPKYAKWIKELSKFKTKHNLN